MDSILREGKLLTSNNLNKKFLTDSPKGQGSKNRKLCDSEESIKNREHFWKHCDEADGVYLEFLEMDTPLKTYTGDIILVFSKDMLYKYSWILIQLKILVFIFLHLVLKENHNLVEK